MSHASANEELSSHNTRDLESTSTFGITDYPGLIIKFAPNILAKQYIPHYKKTKQLPKSYICTVFTGWLVQEISSCIFWICDGHPELAPPDSDIKISVDFFLGIPRSGLVPLTSLHLSTRVNIRPAFFYTKAFIYNSVAICLIIIRLLHHTV